MPADDLISFSGMTTGSRLRRYRLRMERYVGGAQRLALPVFAIAMGIAIGLYLAIDGTGPDPVAPVMALTFAVTAPLLLRRRFPFLALVVPIACLAVWATAYPYTANKGGPIFFVFLSIAFLLGSLADRRRALVGLALVEAAVLAVAAGLPDGFLANLWWIGLFSNIAWAAGFVLGGRSLEAQEARERAQRLELQREEEALRAVAEERARIARELHDLVGHSVSVMTLHAAGVRRLLRPEQEREREALLVIEQTGREALAEMRRLVGVLRAPDEAAALVPQPSLAHLDRLAQQARDSGLPVDVRIEGEPPHLAPGLDLAAYRVVQEGLTNALKHAGAGRAEVVVRYEGGRLEVVVRDDGHGTGGGEKGGHGLAGMRERVAVYGGDLRAGPLPGGGFELRAVLPVEAA